MKQRSRPAPQEIKEFNSLHRIKMIHQIDSIYQGCINSSYQKQGFGIQQTCDFQTYLGFWKNNKADGIGLIIYPNGSIIYGNFYRDQINGIAITDDRKILRIGIFSNLQLVGIGFQYDYPKKTWKMARYLKGLPIQIIKEEKEVKQGVVPKIINIQQSLYNHLSNYLYKKFFNDHDINNLFYHQLSPITNYFGFYDQGTYHGLGVVLERNVIKQVGIFENGRISGFGLRCDVDLAHTQIGFYNKGRKEGLFFERTNGKQKYVDYKRGNVYSDNLNINMEAIKKKQKKHNFQCKDFFSSKTSLPYQQIERIFMSPQVRAYIMRKKLQQEDQKDYQKLPGRSNYPGNINSKAKQTEAKSKSKNQSMASPNTLYFNAQQNRPKSSIQSIRQKMSIFSEIIDDYKEKGLNKKASPKKTIKWNDQNLVKGIGKQKISMEQPLHTEQYYSIDQIAEQENPFVSSKQSNWQGINNKFSK